MSNDTQPEIRFPGFTEAWEQRKLIDLVVRLNKSTNSSRLPKVEFEDIVAGEGRLNKDVSQKFDNRKGIEFLPNDILYGKLRPYLKNWLKATFTGVAIGDFWVFRAKKSDSDFIYSLIQADRYQKAANDTSGTKMPRSDWKKVSGTVFYIPNDLKEQQKIGSFFKQLDDTIALHQRKLDLLKETKKGFLQKMFPKNGAKVPEIRFPGFTEDWEQRKLASMTNYKNGKGHEDKQSTIGKLELINLNSISISGGLKHSGKFIDEADDTLQKDDLVMILSDVGHGDLLGRVALIPEDDRFVLNQRVALLRPNATADPQFLFSYINAHQYYFKAQGAGMSQLNISKGSVENFISFVPIIEEQKKIGTFFKQLDDTIALHQRKLDLLKETKKGFLQKMFV
ncbi:restriction endonuclease subunit S [Enterococcus sp. C45]|uniref:restriction endonuclease subunit S n=1 Tax=Enterococcus sp. C45 TaxID=3231306 RepID=UPI0034A01B7A